MKILITGAGGQFGTELMLMAASMPGVEAVGFTRGQLDVTDLGQTERTVRKEKPDVVIHAAAYTAVDRAEQDEENAYRVNAHGTRHVAAAAEAVGAKMCFISTDYVFDGKKRRPYREDDPTNPLNVYGKSKQAGEKAVQQETEKFFIVRTSWLYGLHGNNFVKTMLALADAGKPLKVVHDQTGSPTYAKDLARFILELVRTDKYGIYHASNTGSCTWYEFAKTIFRYSGIQAEVLPCTTEQYPRPAQRPEYSVMDHMSILANGFQDFRPWQDALRDFLGEMRGMRDEQRERPYRDL